MKMPELTRDEQYLRAYFLVTEFSRYSVLFGELRFLLPAIFIAGVALLQGAHGAMWGAFLYLLGVYIWRVGSVRWSKVARSLIEKYEQRIAELERRDVC